MKNVRFQINSADVTEFEIQFTVLVGRVVCVNVKRQTDFWSTVEVEIESEIEELWAEQLIDELKEAV